MSIENPGGWIGSVAAAVWSASLLGSVLIIAVAFIQFVVGKRLGPNWRFALWMIVLIRLLLPTAPESRFSVFNARSWFDKQMATAPATPQVLVSDRPNLSPEERLLFDVGANQRDTFVPQDRFNWSGMLAIAWAAGVICLGGRLIMGSLWLRWRIRQINPSPCPRLAEGWEESTKEMAVRRLPVMITDVVRSPALFGVFRPKLLMPRELSESLTHAELRHVFLHEMAHLKRRDLISNALISLAKVLHWWNPLVWFAVRQMKLERELACDQMVLRVTFQDFGREGSRSYGETILRLIEFASPQRRLETLVGVAEEKETASKRLEQIATFVPHENKNSNLAILLFTLIFACGLTNAQQNVPTAEKAPFATASEQELKTPIKDVAENRGAGVSPSPSKQVFTGSVRRQDIVKKLNEIVIDYYDVPNEVKLSEIIKDIHRTARTLDPEKKGVNFIISSQLENPGIVDFAPGTDPLTGRPPVKIADYTVTITPALRDITLLGLLNAIMEVAVPPKGGEGAPSLRYAIEEYAVVIGQRRPEPEPLYTRTFKVNPNAFLQGLHPPIERTPGLSEVQQGVRNFLVAAGVDFTTNFTIPQPVDLKKTALEQKAMFFNDRTGVLMARATIGELELVERALQRLNAPQVMFTVEAVELRTKDQLDRLLKETNFRDGLRT